jgi:UDP-glucose 4-epimerase
VALAKVILTGSRGFLGQHLLPQLESKGYEIAAFKGNLLDYEDLNHFLSNNSDSEFVIHLAGKFSGELQGLIDSNCIATYNLVNAMQCNHIKNILFSSSGAVYGEPPENSHSQETDCTHPHTIYGITKKIAETLILNSSLNSIILRFPAVYDTHTSNGVIAKFLHSIQQDKQVCIYGDGTQERNFLHINDACDSIINAISKKIFSIFNISNPKSISINQLVSLLALKYDFTVNYLPKNNNLNKLLLDISKAKRDLDWQPKIVDLVL